MYFFCEPVTASSRSRWHIRKVGPKGMMLGGGADTLSLCGRTVAWDINVPITNRHLTGACDQCQIEYAKLMKAGDSSV